MRKLTLRTRSIACAMVSLGLSLHATAALATERHAAMPVPRPDAARTLVRIPQSDTISLSASSVIAARPAPGSHAQSVTVYLHGLCGEPAHGCPYFHEGVADRSLLVCPYAPRSCDGGGRTWSAPASVQRSTVDAAVAATTSAFGTTDGAALPWVVVGFSQGAYVARSLLRTAAGRVHAVAFIGAYVTLDRRDLDRAGVRRALFAAGRGDGSAPTMRAAAARLQRQGFDARFLDLGATGHSYVPSAGSSGWRDALAWLQDGVGRTSTTIPARTNATRTRTLVNATRVAWAAARR